MKYKISIEIITDKVAGENYGTSRTVYEQIVERDETFLTGVILEVNKSIEEPEANSATRDEPVWEPKKGDAYWYFGNLGCIHESIWANNKFDNGRRNFLGVYETKEKAKAGLLEIRRKLGK